MFSFHETDDVAGTISEAYRLDAALLEKWLNVAGSGFDACVKDQVDSLTSQPTLRFYRVEEDGALAGYFGHEAEGAWMSTIFIVPRLRPRKQEFFDGVRKLMKPVFYCGGFEKNQPACKFYRKMGGTVVQPMESSHGTCTMFQFRS